MLKLFKSAVAMWLLNGLTHLVIKHLDNQGIVALVALAKAIDRIDGQPNEDIQRVDLADRPTE